MALLDDFEGISGQKAVAAADTGIGVGQIISGYGNYVNNNQKASAARFNATLAGQNADLVAKESASNVDQLRYKQAIQAGEERASAGQNGGGINGSDLAVLQQNEMNRELSALNLQYQGTVKRYSYLNQQNLDNYQADTYSKNANTDLVNTGISTTSTLLQGFSRYVNNGGF